MRRRIDVRCGVNGDGSFRLISAGFHSKFRNIVIGLENPVATPSAQIFTVGEGIEHAVVGERIQHRAVRLFDDQVGEAHLAARIPAAEDQPGIAVCNGQGEIDPAVGVAFIADQFLCCCVVDKKPAPAPRDDMDSIRIFPVTVIVPAFCHEDGENQVCRRVDVRHGIDLDHPCRLVGLGGPSGKPMRPSLEQDRLSWPRGLVLR